jgi:hypothetical protein
MVKLIWKILNGYIYLDDVKVKSIKNFCEHFCEISFNIFVKIPKIATCQRAHLNKKWIFGKTQVQFLQKSIFMAIKKRSKENFIYIFFKIGFFEN